MKKTATITLRLDQGLLRSLKIRAIMNDRSANGEISAILKSVLETKKAPGNDANQTPDASVE